MSRADLVPTCYRNQRVYEYSALQQRYGLPHPEMVSSAVNTHPAMHRILRAFRFTTREQVEVSGAEFHALVYDGFKPIAAVMQRHLRPTRLANPVAFVKKRSFGVPLIVVRGEQDYDALRYHMQVVRHRSRKLGETK